MSAGCPRVHSRERETARRAGHWLRHRPFVDAGRSRRGGGGLRVRALRTARTDRQGSDCTQLRRQHQGEFFCPSFARRSLPSPVTLRTKFGGCCRRYVGDSQIDAFGVVEWPVPCKDSRFRCLVHECLVPDLLCDIFIARGAHRTYASDPPPSRLLVDATMCITYVACGINTSAAFAQSFSVLLLFSFFFFFRPRPPSTILFNPVYVSTIMACVFYPPCLVCVHLR